MNITKQKAIRQLKKLGFEMDFNVTGRDPTSGNYYTTIDPIGRLTFEPGGCCGIVVEEETAPGMYRVAVQEAKQHATYLEKCTDPDCDMHEDIPINPDP